ncbi:hypothetical protein HZA97_03600 [Candidatus Woesearchaeota archaeon]|nr:hypothetical protein [Candidatus Woesearchaeota archaeon]
MDYNRYPFWIRRQLERLNVNEANITFNEHYFKRSHRNITEETCIETIKQGSVIMFKSLWPGKLVFTKYFGKENQTYTVVTFFKEDRIEVRTAWKKEGR